MTGRSDLLESGSGLGVPTLQLALRNGSALPFDGERFVPGYKDGSIELEHVHRYALAVAHSAGKDVLDVACGEGYGSDLLAQVAKSVVGVDIDQTTIEHASACYVRDNLRFVAADAVKLPLPERSVDVCVSFETIEHLAQHEHFLQEIRRVLRPGGILIMSSPNRDIYRQRRSSKNPYHVRELSNSEFFIAISRLFPFTRVSKQDTVFGSLIVPVACDEHAGYGDVLIRLDGPTGELSFADNGMAECYSMIVASDASLGPSKLSIYTGDYPDGALPALKGGIQERDAEIMSLRQRVTSAELELQRHVEELARERNSFRERSGKQDELMAKCRETLIEQEGTIEALQKALAEARTTSRSSRR